ncbi:cutinase-domain-containing protein [Phyllosticta capitalensis]|uniref:cutinase n=1 Tax=Phyllosticta capitalensis TaxID=121624 RepID=A0ABR1YNR7_9PEZI
MLVKFERRVRKLIAKPKWQDRRKRTFYAITICCTHFRPVDVRDKQSLRRPQAAKATPGIAYLIERLVPPGDQEWQLPSTSGRVEGPTQPLWDSIPVYWDAGNFQKQLLVTSGLASQPQSRTWRTRGAERYRAQSIALAMLRKAITAFESLPLGFSSLSCRLHLGMENMSDVLHASRSRNIVTQCPTRDATVVPASHGLDSRRASSDSNCSTRNVERPDVFEHVEFFARYRGVVEEDCGISRLCRVGVLRYISPSATSILFGSSAFCIHWRNGLFQSFFFVVALVGANPLPKTPSFSGLGSGIPSLPSATPSLGPGLTSFPTSTPSLPSGLPSFSPNGGIGGPSLVARDGFGSSTQNGLTDGTACKKVSLIFARGTSEGNMGTVVGPPLASYLASAIGSSNLAVQGVEYSASAAGAASGGDASGASKMTSLADNVVKKCPDTQPGRAVGPQGGRVHSSSTASKVKAVVVFGDPLKGQAIKNIDSSIVKTYCHTVQQLTAKQGDEVCDGAFVITQAHLTYGNDTQDAATFIKGKVSV